MPEDHPSSAIQLRDQLARLDRGRDRLAKAWLVRLIERASLDEISDLPTARIAGEVPELISDVLALAAGGEGSDELEPEGRERAERLLELRDPASLSAADLTRDVGAIQLVILEALRSDAADLDPEDVAELASGVADATRVVQAAVVETLMSRRARDVESAVDSDALTGLANLRNLRREIARSLALRKRYGHPFALVVLDVDGLRRINDSQGKPAGDRVLVQVALAVRRTIRSVDLPARIGGDEFCVLVPEADVAAAGTLGDRLAEAVRIETAGPDGPGTGVAIGAVACPEHGEEAGVLLEAADGAMYQAKAAGEAVVVGETAVPEITVERTT